MNRDIITGMDGEIYARRDLSREWGGAIDLGTARTGKSFEVDGHLGETNRCGVWDSVDRLRSGLRVTFVWNSPPNPT